MKCLSRKCNFVLLRKDLAEGSGYSFNLSFLLWFIYVTCGTLRVTIHI